MAQWRAHGAPSPTNPGYLVTAAECAEFTGMTAKCWRELVARGGAPAPAGMRRTTELWDEAEVLRWVDAVATFYRHFAGKDDAITRGWLTEDLIDDLSAAISARENLAATVR